MLVPGMRVRDRRCKRRTCRCTSHCPLKWHMCKPLVNPLYKQPLRLRKCGDQPYCLQNLVKSGLTSLPGGKIMPKRQNSKAKTWSYNCSNAARNNFEERRRFAHQQIHGRGDGIDQKSCRERRKHYGRSCTTSQRASRPG